MAQKYNMNFLKKHFSNILFLAFILILFLNPFGLGMKIRSNIIRLISFSPSVEKIETANKLNDYNWQITNGSESINFNEMKGKVVIINFWATWCPPCVAEMPSLQKLYNDYGNKVQFVLIAQDKPKNIEAFLQKNDYSMPIYYAQSATPTPLHSKSIPATFLIDQQGRILIDKKGAANWNSSSIRELLDNLIQQ